MRAFGVVALVLMMSGMSDPVLAESARKCRKACKPAIAECMALTGQSRRLCRKSLLPLCKREGLEVCVAATTTTVPTSGSNPTTTTTLPSGNTGGGAMSLHVEDVTRQGDEDPRRFSLAISIGYSVVTANAVTQVALDPSTFAVIDEDTDVVYPAEPAGAPGDCSADDVVTKDGPDVTCTVHFMLPAAVGGLSQVGGGTHAKLRFESHGLHGSDFWSY